jgi:phosphotriesterase-related protein
MSAPEQKNMIQTVLGTVKPEEVGPTMTHEHLIIDFGVMFTPPPETSDEAMSDRPVSIENLGWIRQYCYSNFDNLKLLNEETAVKEAILYKKSGGKTIVDATTQGIGRDPLALERISRLSGVNIVMGAGYYVDAAHPKEIEAMDEDTIAATIVKQVMVGTDGTGIKAGIIGEIGCTWPLTANEKKILRASASAQKETGASILIHPGRSESAPLEILEILEKTGASIPRVIIGHLDRTVSNILELKKIADTGCGLEWDLFGNEVSFYQPSDFDMPSDAQRMDLIRSMIDYGVEDRIVISHDICTKHRLIEYGGHGYGYILEHIIPRMKSRGFSDKEIASITETNPANFLTIN